MLDRRRFLHRVTGAFAALPGLHLAAGLRADDPPEERHLIILWMAGGPPTIDMWDPKYGEETAFDDKPIETTTFGVRISPFLPKIARQMKHLSVVRSLSTPTEDHHRASLLMHAGRLPDPVVSFPSAGSVLMHELQSRGEKRVLPFYITIGGGSEYTGPGFLGRSSAPFEIQHPGTVPALLRSPVALGKGKADEERANRRMRLFNTIENRFNTGVAPHATPEERKGISESSEAHGEFYARAFKLLNSGNGKVFEIEPKDTKIAEEYGPTSFGRSCLLARKLVEAGVSVVQVWMGGWDLHVNARAALKDRQLPVLDAGMGTLVKDLVDRGLWKKTVVVCMGEFGRSPKINERAGRDHHSRGWSVVLGGGSLRPGLVHGSTNGDGTEVRDDPCSAGDLFATIFRGLELNPEQQMRDSLARVFPYAEGKPIKTLH